MSLPYDVRAVRSREELEQVLSLQRRNLSPALAPEEQQSQGFVTVQHDLATLERMHTLEPSIIAVRGSEVVAYAR
jgi:hypothetical protein